MTSLRWEARAEASDDESPEQTSVTIDADACDMGQPRPKKAIFSILEEQPENLIWIVTSSPHNGFFP
ncbi:MAG: hypothetical protein VXX88_04215 [Pseudomonadota bacterium]|nr:hypothetical protein [Pseudomonadota bacterium]